MALCRLLSHTLSTGDQRITPLLLPAATSSSHADQGEGQGEGQGKLVDVLVLCVRACAGEEVHLPVKLLKLLIGELQRHSQQQQQTPVTQVEVSSNQPTNTHLTLMIRRRRRKVWRAPWSDY